MQRALLGVVLIVGVACSSAETAGSDAQAVEQASTGDRTVVAALGDREITLADLDSKWRELDPAEQARLQQQLYESRRNVLDHLVGEILIEEAATAAGVTAEQYLSTELAKRIEPVTDAAVKQFYEENKERVRGQPFEQIQQSMREFLEQRQGQVARATLVGELRDKAGSVRVFLDPPRQTIELAAHDPAKGPDNAPVTIVEFSDYQCPYCGRVTPTLDKLMAAYPDKIRLVFKDFPLPNHSDAPKASEAAHCAQEQGKYWEMHDRLFAHQSQLAVPALKEHAATIGLDQAAFDQCLDSGKHADGILADMEAGRELGVASTPTLYINGRPVVGAQPYEYFVDVLEEELGRP